MSAWDLSVCRSRTNPAQGSFVNNLTRFRRPDDMSNTTTATSTTPSTIEPNVIEHHLSQHLDNDTLARFLAAASMAQRIFPSQVHPRDSRSSNQPARERQRTHQQQQQQRLIINQLSAALASSDRDGCATRKRQIESYLNDSGNQTKKHCSNGVDRLFQVQSPPTSSSLASAASPGFSLSDLSSSSCSSSTSTHNLSALSHFTKSMSPSQLDNVNPAKLGSANPLSTYYTCDEHHDVQLQGSCHPVVATTERRARKKDQNRRAAYNYRRKKMEERDRMIEEEAKLVHKHVRLIGRIARLDGRILKILEERTKKIIDKNGRLTWYLCPVCVNTFENIPTLRSHLRVDHFKLGNEIIKDDANCNVKCETDYRRELSQDSDGHSVGTSDIDDNEETQMTM